MTRSLFRLPVLLTVLSVTSVGWYTWPYTVDDAYIVARYGERLAAGKGYTINDGKPTDGVTGPLWLAPAILGQKLGIESIYLLKGCGLICMGTAVWILAAWIRNRAYGRFYSWLMFFLIASQSTFGIWAIAGLETGAATLALAIAVMSAYRRPTPHATGTGISSACLIWIRPELTLASIVVLAGLWLRNRRGGALALLITALSLCSVITFRKWMFGSAFPLAIDAKPASISNGFQYTIIMIGVVTSGIGIWLAWRGTVRNRGSHIAIGYLLIVHLVAVVIVGGDWMPGFRLFAPVMPYFAFLVSVGICNVRWRCKPNLGRSILLVLVCAVPCINAFVQLPEVRAAGIRREQVGGKLVNWLEKRCETVALVDIGYLAYQSGIEVIDLGGITDPVIARYPGGHLSKRIDMDYIQYRNPDALVLHSIRKPLINKKGELKNFIGYPVEQILLAHPWVRQNFRVSKIVRYHDAYFYIILTRLSEKEKIM